MCRVLLLLLIGRSVRVAPLCADAARITERVSEINQDLRRYSGGQKGQSTRFELAGMIRNVVQWVVKAGRVNPDVSCCLPEELGIGGRQGTGPGL